MAQHKYLWNILEVKAIRALVQKYHEGKERQVRATVTVAISSDFKQRKESTEVRIFRKDGPNQCTHSPSMLLLSV